MENIFKQNIVDAIDNFICFINVDGAPRPYTANKNICKTEIKNNITQPFFSVYDILKEEIVNIEFENVLDLKYDTDDAKTDEWIKTIKMDLQNCCFDYKSRDEIEKNYFENEAYHVNAEKKIFNICKLFKFTINDYDIKADTISNVENITKAWKSIIAEKTNENILELNELKKDCSDEDDLEDIDSIIEMFESASDEVDLSDCKNLNDILETYPPLLLPLPDSLKVIRDTLNDSNGESLEQALNLVDTMTYDELQEIYNETQNIVRPNPVVKKVISKIKDILDQKK